MKYDIIGDIHGCHLTLQSLLRDMGYTFIDGVYQQPDCQVIYLGDFIDRGPGQKEVLDIVRPMIDQGHALSVMGNHEFNAIGFATQDSHGNYLREHSGKNIRQHTAFLKAYRDQPTECHAIIAWFKQLPLWLELDGLRVIHACWDQLLINRIASTYDQGGRLTEELLHDAHNRDHWAYDAIETLLKGKEIPLPNGQSFNDKDDNTRHHIRIKWWDQEVTSYRDAFMGPDSALTHIPDDPITGDHLVEYGHDQPPVFLGHYWMEGSPVPLADNIACLDYSVAKPGGKLVAYRWQGETRLNPEHYVCVERLEPDQRA